MKLLTDQSETQVTFTRKKLSTRFDLKDKVNFLISTWPPISHKLS